MKKNYNKKHAASTGNGWVPPEMRADYNKESSSEKTKEADERRANDKKQEENEGDSEDSDDNKEESGDGDKKEEEKKSEDNIAQLNGPKESKAAQ